ncbi:hypothetical protein ASC72_13875 [Flavobacterium sp. Root420]|nr:hypothetical protein ASC72_13875 [Flavobacterium sp. Root420]
MSFCFQHFFEIKNSGQIYILFQSESRKNTQNCNSLHVFTKNNETAGITDIKMHCFALFWLIFEK